MSEPARNLSSFDTAGRPSASSGPLRDWLAAMRATAPDTRSTNAAPATIAVAAPRAPVAEPVVSEVPSEPALQSRPQGWAPRLIVPAPKEDEAAEDASEIVAENMMLRAKLRLESERRDELQLLIAQEIRELRAHVAEEIARLEDVRTERDLWKARCETLMTSLFTGAKTA